VGGSLVDQQSFNNQFIPTAVQEEHMNTMTFSKIVRTTVSVIFILGTVLQPTTSVAAKGISPFDGIWHATDYGDESLMQVTILGPIKGPFLVTWTESYFTFCNGQAGLATGKGKLNPNDPNILEADMRLICFRTGSTVEWHQVWTYKPAYGVLASQDSYGVETIWTNYRKPLVPRMDLRVNYGHDWVEGFYEAGHNVLLTVKDGDGNVKAINEMVTESKDNWGGATGFVTNDSPWFDEGGIPMDNFPDIQPGDWVYVQVDNGLAAKVQIGDIQGAIDLVNDSISGTINALWFTDPVQVECLDWGSGAEQPFSNKDGGAILPDGAASYSCSWAGEWDVQAGQTIGVGYFGSDGHWVANAITTPNPKVGVFPVYEAVELNEWREGAEVHLLIDDPNTVKSPDFEGNYIIKTADWDPNQPYLWIDLNGSIDIKTGDIVTVTDGITTRTHTVLNLDVTNVDSSSNTISGTADTGAEVYVFQYSPDYHGELMTTAADGNWQVNGEGVLDMVPGAGGRSEIRDAQGNSTAVDWSIPNPTISTYPIYEAIELSGWKEGADVHLTVEDLTTPTSPDFEGDYTIKTADWDPNWPYLWIDLNGLFDIKTGDIVTVTDGITIRTHTVRNLDVTNVDKTANTVSGTADPRAQVFVVVWGYNEVPTTADGNGNWTVDFTSQGIDLVEGTGGRSQIRDEVGNSTAVDWSVPNPHFQVWPVWDQIEGWDWPTDAVVHLTIDDPSTPQQVDYEQSTAIRPTPWDPNTFFWPFYLSSAGPYSSPQPGDYVIKPGDIVTLTGGETTRKVTVQNLSITGLNTTDSNVTGTADPGAVVYVSYPGSEIMVTTDENGSWMADFGAQGVSFQAGQCVGADIREEAFGTWSGTSTQHCVPNPTFSVFPELELIQGGGWEDNPTLIVTIAEKPECYKEIVDSGGNIDLWYPPGCDITVGDVVTVTDGNITRTHTVRNLGVTHLDEAANIVTGTADSGAIVNVWVPGHEEANLNVPATDGTWRAEFNTVGFDLTGGMCGYAMVYDEIGDSTAAYWCIPNPRMEVNPSSYWVNAREWPISTSMHMSVIRSGSEVYAADATMGPAPWNPNDPNDIVAHFNLASSDPPFVLLAGDEITMAGGGIERTYIVSRLRITGVDPFIETVSGIAEPGKEVHIWVNSSQNLNRYVTAGVDGNWTGDFRRAGPRDDEKQTIDLQPGDAGGAQVFDDNGNYTQADWSIPNPHFSAFPEWEYVQGWEWPSGTTLSASIDEKPECIAGSTIDSTGYFEFHFPAGCDMSAGDLVTLVDGDITRTHIVWNLAVTVVDQATNSISGTADPGTPVYARVWGYNIDLSTTADVSGNWTIDFTGQGIVFAGGMGGKSEIPDEAGNATRVDWSVPVTLLVTGTEDLIANDGICSLREAVIAANTNSSSGEMNGECPGGLDNSTDTILLPADQTYSLSIDSTCSDDPFCGDLDIWNNSAAIDLIIMVEGGGNATISQDATVDDLVLQNHDATVQIEGLTLTGGTSPGSGGGINNIGTMVISRSTISGNSAGWDGGGLLNYFGSTMTLNDTTVSGNSAGHAGGGIMSWGGELTVNVSAFSNNTAAHAGGIGSAGGTTVITDSSVSGNSASGVGGVGGGLFNWGESTLTLKDTTVSGNTAVAIGGGVFNYGWLTITGSSLVGNTADGEGDAVYSATDIVNAMSITGSCIVGNGNIAVFNERYASQNFTGNWWGDASGPTHWSNPGGIGDSVSDYIDFSSWLIESPSICTP
jgi:hypothetical protein